MAKMEKDILDDEKLSREREVDKERDEDRHSKEVQRMKEKETISKSNAILENSKIDVLRDSKSRDILEKAIRIHKNNCRELQQQYAEKFSKIDLSKKGSREVEQAARLSREIRTLQSNIDKIHERLNPHMAREKINSTERSQDLIKRVEKNEIMISSGKIEIRPTYVSKVASLDKEKVSLALDIAKYQSLTGMSLSNDAKSTISKLDIKRSSERIIPKQELEKIATSKHPEAIKTFYEMGLRIGDERLRPEQLNNVFKAISITEDRAGKIEIIDRMLAGKIQNIKMSEKDIEKLSKDCTRIGIEKQTKKSEIQKSQQKQDRDKDRSDLKKELLRQPEKTNEKVKDLLLSSQEKLNLNELSSIIKQSDALLDSKGLKSERIELSSDEIRQIALGNHPENLSIAFQLGARIGENLRVDDKKLNIAINLLDELKERDETIRLTYISSAIKPIDEREGKVFIGREDEKDKIEKLLNVQINSSLSIRERNECLRKELERINHPEKFEQREKTPEKREVEPLDLRGLDAKEAAKEISRFLGEICQKERTSSEDRKSYVAAQRDDKDYSREYVLQQLSLARETIRDERIDIRSMDVKDIALRDKDLISIVSRDPQLLIDVQRMGIPITRNGFINEEKLQKKIDLLTEYSKDEARRKEGMFSIEDRVAIISSAWARNTGQHIALSNSVNMMDSRANDYVKATAIKFATLDEYLKLSSEERSNPKNNYLSKVAYERNTELDRYRHASTKINLERNIFDGRYSDMRDFYKSHKNLFSDKSVDRKTQIIKELDDKREDRPKTLNGFHSELILSKNFEGYLRDIIELSRNDDKHERYEKDNIEINKGFVLINQEQLERLISILPPVREDRDQVLPPFNERGQTMPNIDITDRLVLLNATGITHDLLSKSDNIPYSLLQDRQRDIEKRTEEFQDYLERLYDTRNPLDSKISSEIILDYFKNIRYDARLVSPEKELSDYDISRESSEYRNAVYFLSIEKINAVDRRDETDSYKIIRDANTSEIKSIMIKNIDSLNDNLREDVKKVKAYYGNTDVPNVDIISKENEIIDRMKSVEVPHSDYYRIDVLDNKQPVLTFNIEDTEKMIERSSELSTAGISFRIELPTEESRFGRIEFFNLNKYNVSSISEELYDTLSSARNDSGISFSDIRPVDNLEVYREANNLITQYTTALREISESTDSSRILEIYNSISQPIDYFFSSEAFLDKIYHTSVGQSVSEDLFACRDAFNSLVSQYIEINPLNYNESYNDDNYYNYVEDRNSSLHDELSELQIWTAIDMLEVDADRLEIAPELREYYEEIVKIENEIESYLIENNPDMEEYRFSFDFKTNQAVITDRDDFSVVYATFERNEEREDIFVPNFEHGEDRGMLMLDYQRDLTELYDRVDSYRERFIDDIKQKEEESQRGIVNTSLYEHSVEDILSKIDSKDIDADDARSLAREHLVLREILTELNNPHDFATINTLTIDETEVTNLLYQIATN